MTSGVRTFLLNKISLSIYSVIAPILNVVVLLLTSIFATGYAVESSKIESSMIERAKRFIWLMFFVIMALYTLIRLYFFNAYVNNTYKLGDAQFNFLITSIAVRLISIIVNYFFVVTVCSQMLEKYISNKKVSIKPYLIIMPLYIATLVFYELKFVQ